MIELNSKKRRERHVSTLIRKILSRVYGSIFLADMEALFRHIFRHTLKSIQSVTMQKLA